MDFRQQDHELVASPPAYRVALSHAGLEATGDSPQELVAEVVAVLIIDFLEQVQVDEQNSRLLAVTACQTDHLDKVLVQQKRVGQAGEMVVQSQVSHAPGNQP